MVWCFGMAVPSIHKCLQVSIGKCTLSASDQTVPTHIHLYFLSVRIRNMKAYTYSNTEWCFLMAITETGASKGRFPINVALYLTFIIVCNWLFIYIVTRLIFVFVASFCLFPAALWWKRALTKETKKASTKKWDSWDSAIRNHSETATATTDSGICHYQRVRCYLVAIVRILKMLKSLHVDMDYGSL